MKFSYIVLGGDNREQRGTIDAPSVSEATKLLLEQGWFIKKLAPIGRAKTGFREFSFGGVPLIDRVLFTKHLAMMMKSGISLHESLEAIGEQTPNRRFKKILVTLLDRLRGGQSLASSMGRFPKVFDQLYVNIIQVGEESGTLEENLNYLAKDLDDRLELRRRVRAASFYPAIILASTLGLGLMLSYFVLPKITKLFRTMQVELPLSTKILLGTADLMDKHGGVIIAGIIFGLIALRFFVTRKFMRPFTHWLLLHLPILGSIAINYNLAGINRTLSILLRTGLTIDHAIAVTADTTVNAVYREKLRRSIEQIRKGKRLSEVFRQANQSKRAIYFPMLVTKMVSVGERSGRLDESFSYIAEYFEKEVDATMKNLTTILEPVLLVGIGLIVGFVAISVISPIYQVTSRFQQ